MGRVRHIAADERGASIVIALVFFLICGIIGSVVVTAASVQAKSVQTHKELQQAEFAVGSAAQVIGYELDMAELKVSDDEKTVEYSDQYGNFAGKFWEAYGTDILEKRAARQTYVIPETLSFSGNVSDAPQELTIEVYGKVTVDIDLNITVDLSLSDQIAQGSGYESSPYNMRVTIQCIPTYDAAGKLISFGYERAVIQKMEGLA